MAKYVYPAVFTLESTGSYSVNFRDFEACYTCGENLEEAIEMAEDVLSLTLLEFEIEKKELPVPSKRTGIALAENEFINLIMCDTSKYRKQISQKSVRKNVTIPGWLNEEAERLNLNFSQILQEALEEKVEKSYDAMYQHTKDVNVLKIKLMLLDNMPKNVITRYFTLEEYEIAKAQFENERN